MGLSRRTRILLLLFCICAVVVRADEDGDNDEFSICHEVVDQSPENKCDFVRQYCQAEAVGYFNYMEAYYCSSRPKQVLVLSATSVWLLCLFMTIGIAASDFLCPNLNTIANILGLSESLVGVTFLAFGNGSPDVFSTWAAMKLGSGSLALGELIGAASFIAAVVVGSMALVKPFKVARKSFMRDVIFYLIAMSFAMMFVSDGTLEPWECIVMLALYVCYVCFVVWWHWYNSRKRRRYVADIRARQWYTEPGTEQVIEDDEEAAMDSNPLLSPNGQHSISQLENDEVDEDAYNEVAKFMHKKHRQRSGSVDRRGHVRHQSSPIRPSLFNALEFRTLVQNLENSKANNGSSFQLVDHEREPFTDDETSDAGSDLSHAGINSREDLPRLVVTDFSSEDVTDAFGPMSAGVSTPASGRASFDSHSQTTQSRPHIHNYESWMSTASSKLSINYLRTLFPNMEKVSDKPWHGIISSIITTPSVFLLTVTVPVYETEVAPDKIDPNLSSLSIAGMNEEDVRGTSEDEKLQIPRWLLFLQATLTPLAAGIFMFVPGSSWLSLLLCSTASSVMLYATIILIYRSADAVPRDSIRFVSFLGFAIAILWVSTIANEVVGVLKMLGIVTGVSDAILGVTVFAMGNSLGDLVANFTVAKMGFPMMALSACFGGPMLNILVGVGVSCLIVLMNRGAALGVYHVDLSPSLIISGATLLITLIFLAIAVPLNNWEMSRWIGVAMIVFWSLATAVNILIEIV